MPKGAGKKPRRSKSASSNSRAPLFDPSSDEHMLKIILDNAHEGIAIVGDNYILEYINEPGAKIFGGKVEDLIGYDFRQFMKDDMAKLVTERYERRRTGERVPEVYSFRILRTDDVEITLEGRVEVMQTSDGKTKTIAHFLDITQLLENRTALEESETRYKILVETMNDGLAIDDETGNLVYANEAFCSILGYKPEEIVGKRWIELTVEMGFNDFKSKVAERKAGVSESYELTWVSKTGELIPTIVSATPYIDRQGNFIGTFAVITEISSQKEAEETVQFYLDLLSHDIANQLQVIMTSSGLLEEEVSPSYVDDVRQDILDAVERCNRLITKVKRAAQIRHIPLSRIDLLPVLKEKIKVLERVYDARVHVKGLKKSSLVEADVLIGEMVWNLLENAARHNPKEEKQVWITCEEKTDVCRLIIADDGPGLSDMRKKTLFTERKRGGGVGIALVSQMIRKYGGSIEVQNRVAGKPSMGSKFIVTLRKAEPRKKQ
jgi:PAS domain S-box-containing protein